VYTPRTLQDKFTRSVASVVAVGQAVRVKVLSMDAAAGRIALTMKGVTVTSGLSRLQCLAVSNRYALT
jgi:ribosomal protein S1